MLIRYNPHESSRLDDLLSHACANRCEFYASDLMEALEVDEYDRIERAVAAAMRVCVMLRIPVQYHFRVVFMYGESGIVQDYRLSRLACCLVTMNTDPDIPAVARAQFYLMTGK